MSYPTGVSQTITCIVTHKQSVEFECEVTEPGGEAHSYSVFIEYDDLMAIGEIQDKAYRLAEDEAERRGYSTEHVLVYFGDFYPVYNF